MSKSLEEMMASIEARHRAAGSPDPTYPVCYWSDAGRCCFLYLEGVAYYADRTNPYFHLYRAQDDNRVIGGVLFPDGMGLGELVYKRPEQVPPQ